MNKEIEITIDHLTKDGVGVSRLENGKNLYVANCFSNEKLLVTIDYEGKKQVYGHIKKVLVSNPSRVNPKCDVYYSCGGCHLSFMSYDAQLKFKQEIVKKIYEKAGFNNIIVHETIGMDYPYEYRNKVQTPVKLKKGKIVAGFYKENSHDVVPFNFCHVQSKQSNEIIKKVLLAMNENKIEFLCN